MKRRLIMIAAVIVLLVGLVWQVLTMVPREPVYHGRPLSDWLMGFESAVLPRDLDTPTKVVNEAGTNAIPTLLRMMRAHDSPPKAWFFTLMEKQHVIEIQHVNPLLLNDAAYQGFRVLGPRAASAVPELIKIYDRHFSFGSQLDAGLALAEIGPPARAAIPSLLRETRNTNEDISLVAIKGLGAIHEDPDAVVPVLIQRLLDIRLTAISAVQVLGQYGPDAKASVPALTEFIRSQHRRKLQMSSGGDPFFGPDAFGRTATDSLQKIDPAAAAKLADELHETW